MSTSHDGRDRQADLAGPLHHEPQGSPDTRTTPSEVPQDNDGHGGHGWMMIACCIPMLVVAVILVATGVVGLGFLVVALACTAMMALMMRGMHVR